MKAWGKISAAAKYVDGDDRTIDRFCEDGMPFVTLYMPAGGASRAPYSTLFGRPVIPIEQCQTVGTTGDIILGDFSNGYIAIDRGAPQTAVSLHVRFLWDEQVFRFRYRADGQPVLSSPVTPYKGSATQSHFVKLNSRT